MEEGKRKSPRRSPQILSNVDTSNQKVYRRSRMRGQISSSTAATDEVNDDLNISLGMHVHGKGKKRVKEVNNVKKSKKRCVGLESTSKKIVDGDDDFEDLPPQFQSKKLKNKDGPEKKKPVKDAKTRNRLPKNVILPESRDPAFSKFDPDMFEDNYFQDWSESRIRSSSTNLQPIKNCREITLILALHTSLTSKHADMATHPIEISHMCMYVVEDIL